jgi:hypothetical protein
MHERLPRKAGTRISVSHLEVVLASVLLLGVLARAQASLVPDLIAGDDGPYYLVQVRAILRHGTLAIPDFPLLFYAQAALAVALSLAMETPAAIVAAVRWIDTIVPVLLAFPVYQFVRAFSRAERSAGAVLAMALAGLLAVASGNALGTAGGALKNATTLPFALGFLYYAYRGLRDGDRRSLAAVALCFTLSSLIHIGGLALNVTMLALLTGFGMLIPETRRVAGRAALVMLACLLVALLVVLLLDPVRFARFTGPLSHPGWLFDGAPLLAWLAGVPSPAVAEAVASEEIWIGNALGGAGLYALWRHRARMTPADRVTVGAATMATLVLASPLLRPDVLERLAQLAFVPGLVPLSYLLCVRPRSVALAAPVVLLALVNGALALKTLRLTGLTRPAHEELAGMKAAVPPGRTLVIARHGLEWWAVWTLDTHFSNWAGWALAHRDGYDAVLLLDEIAWGAFGVSRWSRVGPRPGTGVFDGSLLHDERFTTLAEGRFFRLSRLEAGP